MIYKFNEPKSGVINSPSDGCPNKDIPTDSKGVGGGGANLLKVGAICTRCFVGTWLSWMKRGSPGFHAPL